MSAQWQAPLFYKFIKENNPNIFEKLDIFKKNDTIGQPEMWISEDGISISPNTLRYVKTLVDLETAFGSLDGFVVAELGVGYGGLCYVINSNNKLKDYVICDLPEVEQLAKKYLSKFNIDFTNDRNKHKKFDLFVSEFCLSEFNDEWLYKFYNDLIIKSDRIYLTMNMHEEDRKSKFLNKVKEDFNITVMDEYPKTQWPNYIVIGNKK
jgi:6-pyruvoyl-tetrahydropterin synthase